MEIEAPDAHRIAAQRGVHPRFGLFAQRLVDKEGSYDGEQQQEQSDCGADAKPPTVEQGRRPLSQRRPLPLKQFHNARRAALATWA